jgi:hypothetical protein
MITYGVDVEGFQGIYFLVDLHYAYFGRHGRSYASSHEKARHDRPQFPDHRESDYRPYDVLRPVFLQFGPGLKSQNHADEKCHDSGYRQRLIAYDGHLSKYALKIPWRLTEKIYRLPKEFKHFSHNLNEVQQFFSCFFKGSAHFLLLESI